jgi:hypothetical protein
MFSYFFIVDGRNQILNQFTCLFVSLFVCLFGYLIKGIGTKAKKKIVCFLKYAYKKKNKEITLMTILVPFEGKLFF